MTIEEYKELMKKDVLKIGLDVDEIKFRESGIGVATRKALETASARIVARMVRKGIFEN